MMVAKAAATDATYARTRSDAAYTRAESADNHAIKTYQLLEGFKREFDVWKGEVMRHFGNLETRISNRASKGQLRALENDVEDTKTRLLREDIAKAEQAVKSAKLETKVWRGAVVTIFVAVVAIVLKLLLGH